MLTNLASYSVFIVVTFLVLSWFTKSYAESSLRLRILVILIGIFLLLMVTSVESPTDRSSMALPIGLNIVTPLTSLRPQKSLTSWVAPVTRVVIIFPVLSYLISTTLPSDTVLPSVSSVDKCFVYGFVEGIKLPCSQCRVLIPFMLCHC